MEAEKRAWAEISLDAIEHNIKQIQSYVGNSTKVLGVVKADAYGHGYREVAEVLLESGVDFLAVAFIDEALQLRKCGITAPILILGHTATQYADVLVKNDITPGCFSMELAREISNSATRQNKKAKIHIKIDTGMGRVGFRYTDDEAINDATVKSVLEIATLPNIEIEGIFTHFSVADAADDDYTYMQFNRFSEVCDRLRKNDVDIPIRHCCNSAALIRFPQMHMDMVRPGIIQYGLKPSEFVDCTVLDLKPAMQFKTHITYIKEVEENVSVSYGRRFTSDRKTKIATIPVGYADGYSRTLSGKAEVIVRNKKCRVIGNICMDQCMIDVTDVNNISIGDDVILFGKSDEIEMPAESLAEQMGTINYEILCVIGKRIPRVYIRHGRVDGVHNYLLDPPVSEK